MRKNLSGTTQAEIARMTRIIAGRMGYNVNDPQAAANDTALEQFSGEMSAYIEDNIQDYIQKGLEEEEALIATQQKLSGDGFNTSMNEFFNKYGGAKEMQKPNISRPAANRAVRNVNLSVIQMLYIAFALIGLGFGALVGKIVGMLVTGIICGLIIGIGLGIVTHAVTLIEQNRK